MSGGIRNSNITLGGRIRECRKHMGETQKDLAVFLNKSESAVRMWELDKSEPDIETLKLIAEHFSVTVGYLINEANRKNDVLSVSAISEYELRLIAAYRELPHMQDAVNKLLGLEGDDFVRLYAAAKSESNQPDSTLYMRKSEWDALRSAPETDEDLM